MCGIVGLWRHPVSPASTNTTEPTFVDRTVYRALTRLQHRGQAGYGISRWSPESGGFTYTATGRLPPTWEGVVSQQRSEHVSTALQAEAVAAIGHVRYPTSHPTYEVTIHPRSSPSTSQSPCQPFESVHPVLGPYALCHNGHIPVFPHDTSSSITSSSVTPSSSTQTDTQTLIQWINEQHRVPVSSVSSVFADSQPSIPSPLTWDALLSWLVYRIERAFTLLVLTPKAMYAVRDRYGVRPLCIGWNHDGYMVCSESCALDRHLNQSHQSHQSHPKSPNENRIEPGEVVRIANTNTGSSTRHTTSSPMAWCTRHVEQSYAFDSIVTRSQPVPHQHCVFESIYFASPQSIMDGESVGAFRRLCGEQLYANDSVVDTEPTLVCGSPRSGILAGQGYATASGLPYVQVLIKNPNYTSQRTFILENDTRRIQACRNKFCIAPDHTETVNGASVILVDDSIVRGHTMRHVVKLLLDAGAREVHVRVASPPVQHPCQWGIDMPTRAEMVYHQVQPVQQPYTMSKSTSKSTSNSTSKSTSKSTSNSNPECNSTDTHDEVVDAIARQICCTTLKYLSLTDIQTVRDRLHPARATRAIRTTRTTRTTIDRVCAVCFGGDGVGQKRSRRDGCGRGLDW